MPQFDQYVIGVLLITTFVVFGALHFIFLTQILVPVKKAIGMRERLISLIKKAKMMQTKLPLSVKLVLSMMSTLNLKSRLKIKSNLLNKK